VPVGRGSILRGVVLILVGIVPGLVYRFTGGGSAWTIGAIAVAQATALIWLLARNLSVRLRAMLIAAVLIVAVAVPQILQLGLSARSEGLVVEGICHAAAYSSLLTWFARSLRPGREPVVTGFARRMRRTMPNEVVRYTRHVTFAWCIFFATQIGISAGLLLTAPVAVWSSFVTLWNLPLVVAMILAEFGCRSLLFGREQRTGLIATLVGLRHMNGSPGRGP
jgi:uncharacterized membrane protein